MKQKQKWTNIGERFHLAGVCYSDYQQVSKCLKPSLILQVVGVPSNPHDSKAISIRHAGVHLGWVPMHSAEQRLAWFAHRSGAKVIAVLTAYNKNNPTHSMITVQLKFTVMCKEVPNEVNM